jgi:hypothetical protein
MNPSWTGTEWVAQLALAAWHPITQGDSVHAEFLSEEPSSERPPTPPQLHSLAQLVANQGALYALTLEAIRAYYDRMRPKYVAFALKDPTFMGDPNVNMPESPDDSHLAKLHHLQVVYVHDVSLTELAYVGLLFSAEWEPEHGVGVLLHGDRVVETGGADTSFLEWIAEKDRDAVSSATAVTPP